MIAYARNGYSTQRGASPSPRPLKFQEMLVWLVDLSPSMGSQFRLAGNRTITRLEALKEAAAFVITQKAASNRLVQVSIVGFAERVHVFQDWTALSSLERVVGTVNSVSIGPLGRLTNIAGALELGLEQIACFATHPATRRQAKLQLVTDGKGNVQTEKHDALIARARREGVKVFTVGVSNQGDDPDTCDPAFLFRLARETGGWFKTAQSLDQLKHALAGAY